MGHPGAVVQITASWLLLTRGVNYQSINRFIFGFVILQYLPNLVRKAVLIDSDIFLHK
jgi:hypothetical protein